MFWKTKFARFALTVGMILLGGLFAPPSVQEVAASITGLQNAIDSTVFIDVERNYRGEELDGSGTGFFISRDGLILTNYHVVGDWLEMWVGDKAFMVELSVIALSVVVHPRTPQQIVLPAKVLALDRDRDLALIRVNYNSNNYLPFEKSPAVALLDEIVICGFPLGGALVLDERGFVSREGGYPEVSVNTGRVTSIRRDDNGEKVAIQTDAAINFGNSGGPMIFNGKPVGVVFAKIYGGSQIGFAIPGSKIHEFLSLQSIKAKFWPSRITASRVPISLTVKMGPLCSGATKGTATLIGSDIPETEYELKMQEKRMTAMLELPDVVPGKPAGEHYEVRIVLTDDAGKRIAGHRFLLRRKEGSAGSDDKERVAFEVIHNEMSLQEYATRQARAKAVEDGTARGTSGGRYPTGTDEAGIEAEKKTIDPELLAEIKKRARSFYLSGEYETAKELYRQVVEVAPDDEIARDYYLLASDRLLIGNSGGGDAASVSVVHDENGTVKRIINGVDVTFSIVSPSETTTIVYSIDGEQQDDIVLSKSQDAPAWGNPERVIEISAGKHVLEIEVGSIEGEKASFRFEEKFKPGSNWTLRINVPADTAPSAYLVRART